ncbi:NADPH-dependent F420 reductase [Methanobrevibacter sp.]
MKIGIIGVGAIGGTIARKLAKKGHSVKVANSRGKESVKEFADEIGGIPSDINEISHYIDVLILSVPYGAVESLPKTVFSDLPSDAIVVDTGNYYPEVRNETIEGLENGEVESVWLSNHIGRPVIKAFNTLLAYSLAELGRENGEEGRLAMQVAGDDEKEKEIVMNLVDQCGFDPYDAGTLAESWKMQPTSAGYCCDYTAEELKSIKEKSTQTPESVAENRAKIMGNFADLTGGDFSHENVISMNRKYNI